MHPRPSFAPAERALHICEQADRRLDVLDHFTQRADLRLQDRPPSVCLIPVDLITAARRALLDPNHEERIILLPTLLATSHLIHRPRQRYYPPHSLTYPLMASLNRH